MNGNDLLEKMSEVDPKLIEDADKITEEQQPRKKRALFIGITSGMATVAAALAIVAVIGTNSSHKPSVDYTTSGYDSSGTDGLPSVNAGGMQGTDSTDKAASDPEGATASTEGGNIETSVTNAPEDLGLKPQPVDNDAFSQYGGSLPKITNKDYGIRGMGGLSANTTKRETSLLPSELEIRSPWSIDAQLKTLPVYLSNSTTPDVDKMKEHVKSAAAALGIAESELEITDTSAKIFGGSLESYRKTMEDQGVPEDEIERELERVSRYMGSSISIIGKANGITLNLYTDYSMKVSFDEPYVALPNGCSLGENATENEKRAATEYLAEKYKTLLGYENAKIARYGEYTCDFRVFEAAGDLTAQIVNYSLKNARFCGAFEDPTKMDTLWVLSTGNLEKLGDYPIYTPQQALWVLSSDSTPEESRLPADAEIVKVDIVYNNRQGYTAVLPYYEFYVKSDREPLNEGETEYDIYTIAAVPEQFIDMEIGDFGVRA